MKIDTSAKYDIQDILSSISSQVIDNNNENQINGTFSELMATMLNNEKGVNAEANVAISGNQLPLSLSIYEDIFTKLPADLQEQLKDRIIDFTDSTDLKRFIADKKLEDVPKEFVSLDMGLAKNALGENEATSNSALAKKYLSTLEQQKFIDANFQRKPKVVVKNLNESRPVLLGEELNNSSQISNMSESDKFDYYISKESDNYQQSTSHNDAVSSSPFYKIDMDDRSIRNHDTARESLNKNIFENANLGGIEKSKLNYSRPINFSDKSQSAHSIENENNQVLESIKLEYSEVSKSLASDNFEEEAPNHISKLDLDNIEKLARKYLNNKNDLKVETSASVVKDNEKLTLDEAKGSAASNQNFGQLFSSSEQSVNNVFDKFNGFAFKGENTIDLSRFIDNEITADSDSREPARNVFGKFAENISSTLGGIIQTNKPGHYKFTTSLYPENLGALEVNIEYSEEYGIKINLVGENLKAVQIMQENATALKNSINVADSLELNISLNDAKDENNSSQAFAGDQEFSDTGKSHQNDLIVESDEVTELGVNISSPYSIDRLV